MENPENDDASCPVRFGSLRTIHAERGPASRSSNVPAMPTEARPPTPVLPDHRTPFQPPRPLLYSHDAPARPDGRTATAEGSDSFRAPLPLAVIFFFLVGFFSIYILRDLMEHISSAWVARRGGGGPRGPQYGTGARGLDAVVLDAFPVRRYSSMKDGQCGAECAVCLSEFDGEDEVRLLTVCRHAFHRGCIDLWLASHSTCPVCRSDLEKTPAPENAVEGVPEEGRQGSTAGAEMATQNGVQLQMGSPRATGLREGGHAEDGHTLRMPE